MSTRCTWAVAARVLTQLRRDHRTAVMLLLPCALTVLLWWMFRDAPGEPFARTGPALLAIFRSW